MNGVHDMGGMHGMGPIEREKNEPVFHARWEGAGVRAGARDGRLAQVEHRRLAHPAIESHPSGRISAHELLREMAHGAQWS